MICDNCVNKDKDFCQGLFPKVDCFLHYLHDKKLIYISNGSEGIGKASAIVELLTGEKVEWTVEEVKRKKND